MQSEQCGPNHAEAGSTQRDMQAGRHACRRVRRAHMQEDSCCVTRETGEEKLTFVKYAEFEEKKKNGIYQRATTWIEQLMFF